MGDEPPPSPARAKAGRAAAHSGVGGGRDAACKRPRAAHRRYRNGGRALGQTGYARPRGPRRILWLHAPVPAVARRTGRNIWCRTSAPIRSPAAISSSARPPPGSKSTAHPGRSSPPARPGQFPLPPRSSPSSRGSRTAQWCFPGLDESLDAEGWAAIGAEDKATGPAHGHPQYQLKQLIGALGVARDDVTALGASTVAPRTRLLSEAMRPSATLEAWSIYGAGRACRHHADFGAERTRGSERHRAGDPRGGRAAKRDRGAGDAPGSRGASPSSFAAGTSPSTIPPVRRWRVSGTASLRG